ncbi:YnbE family lipoprotein [Caenispirillum bisanense]|uniref:YnbE-like lipoprotein n=1 Tax=Caenispirillum bisanense TaxID=414052 RepID=A0A286GMF6_9PROT|nr:YnbE family lipoprotein [Caenispirillum bisanense]SOD96725.1 YnbE-like lipoprotein [Caenispirillum bisanense]
MIRLPRRPVLPTASAAAPAALAAVALLLAACQPTVKVEAPDKPIVINLNVKIEQEVRVKVEKDVEDLLQERKDLF